MEAKHDIFSSFRQFCYGEIDLKTPGAHFRPFFLSIKNSFLKKIVVSLRFFYLSIFTYSYRISKSHRML